MSLLPCDIKYKQHGNRTKDVDKLRKEYGNNSFTKRPRKTFFRQYLSAFGDPIIKILLAALALNVLIAFKNANIYEPLGIAAALFLATFVSTVSEYGSESAFLKLEQQAALTQCRVMRDRKLVTLPVSELVVTDIVYLSAGERVPADGIMIKGAVLVDQSALNGESAEVQKLPGTASDSWDLSCKNQIFRGSVITSGECIMAVGRTGDKTFYGNVASEIQSENVKSPLTQKLNTLAGVLSKIGYGAAILVFAADLFNLLILDNAFDPARIMTELTSLPVMISNLLHAVTLAITVIVVAIPEGLPMMITVVLSANMRRLKKDNVLVRRLVGIESSGSLNILFCDKTGTLTSGRLSVGGFYDINGRYFKDLPQAERSDIICCCQLGCDSTMIGKSPVGGNATDRALLSYVYDKSFDSLTISKKIPFDSTKKYSAINYKGTWYIKGAPEILFSKASNVNKALLAQWKKLVSDGVRVIALAKSADMLSYDIIGIISIKDKIRHDARYSVKTVQNAGINVCMVTGDNADTAKSIAGACSILTDGAITLTSQQMSELSDSELAAILPRLKVVSRALPADKSRLVRVSQSIGLVCGMTGDGINDAPALKQADVGFAMGSGTEVAKQAGDIVILDDNFTSISKAILYGRTIFKSIRKFIVFQLTMNLCAVGISIIGPFIGIDTPITVMQMLWINIIMDTLAGLAYAGEPPLTRYMNEKPVRRSEHVLNGRMAGQILTMGIYSLCLCTAFLSLDYFKKRFGFYHDTTGFMTAFFALFIFSGIFAGFSARSDRLRLFANLSKNRAYIFIFLLIIIVQLWLIYYGGSMFRTSGIPVHRLPEIILLGASVIAADMIRKITVSAKRKT